MKYDRIHKVPGEKNVVLVVSEGHLGIKHNSFYDLLRVENVKIAEHWGTIESSSKRKLVKQQRKILID